ncbi:type 11 methyltransferase [Reticulibacter mediterranei]|uniref:Type 11 methyltransferase n=1 Tax=Reticulibacter mediterranei TaxID=2778369 RepID=A0A8J3N7A7_9CHLR|nr:class I SAM-dependent methyltransferase [Reticulibacter mediterranei]GHP01020.1 type 11 methyltransferase [Reticulibacter mediterranei]
MNNSLNAIARQLARRHGEYGIDAPYVPLILGMVGLFLLVVAIVTLWIFHTSILSIIILIYALFIFLNAASYLYTTRWGKFQVWAETLTELPLRGDEQVLDIGCGRGAVLLMAAALLSTGKGTGVDLWKTSDQSGNARSVTLHNAQVEGVADRVELLTADMRELPCPDDSFDVVLSSLAIHNIQEATDREQAISEAVRVLKPGGRLLIVDFRETQSYAAYLQKLGMVDVTHRILDWRFWYGGPWTAAKLVSARKIAH